MHPAGPSAITPIPFAALQAEILPAATPQRAAITAAYRRDEVSAVQWLLEQVRASSAETTAEAQALAHNLVSNVRQKRTRASGVDALMHEFSLSSEEGVALMCLAQASGRIAFDVRQRRYLGLVDHRQTGQHQQRNGPGCRADQIDRKRR